MSTNQTCAVESRNRFLPFYVGQAQMHMGAISGEMTERFGHECGPESMLLRYGAHHPSKKCMAIGRGQGIGVCPVNLELAVTVFVVVCVGIPAQLLHITK